MDFTFAIAELAGAVALLLWGVHMVQTGVQRAFGARLRAVLGRALANRFQAFLVGMGVTALLQSSTATGLMVSGFVAGGLVDLVPALAVMLGANVGTTLIVQALSFNVASIAPVLILVGFLLFRRGASPSRDMGRAFIGLGLMLMALHQLLAIIAPYEDAPSLRLILGAIATEPVVDVILAAALTWAAHSSVAVVLLTMSLAAQGAVPPHAAFALVLGANLGTAINPVLEGAAGNDPAARRLPLGNLLNRAAAVLLGLAALGHLGPLMVGLEPDVTRAVADFHTLFNAAVALLCFPLLPFYARLLVRLLPARMDAADPGRPLYLDPSAQDTPVVALGNAAREALRLVDVLEAMLQGLRDALDEGDRRRIAETKRMDDVLDRLNTAIKAYLSTLDSDALSDADQRRALEILTFAMNMEHAGDVVDRNLMGLARKRLKRGLAFSAEGQRDLLAMVDSLIVNLRTAGSLFMTGDARAARLLAGEKEAFRRRENEATTAHFARLSAGRVDSTETSALHLDLLRDLKRVNTHLVEAAAYPVLERSGDLLPSRLKGHQPADAREDGD
ncbi:Na/Pi-cotransporter II-related protein [Nitrospirillum viridazoti Y2]|uniref:Phosphate:Na+ symporter n=1 Tax=Nitrospirillum amazonense TaxID=28077 RepID=A0A560I6B8_9PROT|nr:Na/Pi cotransporter family protein [Nitrospirillum amazonense]EGY00999.1 Na/Pi-cotransporter II-related protein [Nitrospirillum amazonense Y2]TWB54517.1 phosphate:Na+ symporter [Nitrospirillum amazonense]